MAFDGVYMANELDKYGDQLSDLKGKLQTYFPCKTLVPA